MEVHRNDCQSQCKDDIEDIKQQVNQLTNSLLNRNGNGRSSVNIGGDYAGRDKTNVPTVVLLWIVIAVMALGLAGMGAKLVLTPTPNTNIQVTPANP
jgi:hypothetical protein